VTGEPVPSTAISEVRTFTIGRIYNLSNVRDVLKERKGAGHRVKTVHILGWHLLRYASAEIEELREMVDDGSGHPWAGDVDTQTGLLWSHPSERVGFFLVRVPLLIALRK
jgi:hypothetical protein